MSRTKDIFIILTSLSLCSAIAVYLDGHSIRILPDKLRALLPVLDHDYFTKLTNPTLPPTLSSNVANTAGEQNYLFNNYQFVAHGVKYICNNEKLAINDNPGGTIFKWTDTDGTTHITNQKQKLIPSMAKTITFASHGKDYFEIAVSYPNGHLNHDIKSDAARRATAVYEIISNLIGLGNMAKTSIALSIYSNKKDFSEYRQKIAPALSANTSGFYSSGPNIAAVLHEDDIAKTISIALHEILHVINNGSFGLMPDWINEGLAEYFEDLMVSSNKKTIKSSDKWDRTIEENMQRIPLRTLFAEANDRWGNIDRAPYYAVSWSIVSFLMEPQNRPYMADFLSMLAVDKCDSTDSIGFFNARYPGGMSRLQSDWGRYVKGKKTLHYF